MLLGSLSVDIGTHDLKRCAADTADKIGAVPELRFLVESRKVCAPSMGAILEVEVLP